MKSVADKFDSFWLAWPSPQEPQYSEYKRKTDKKKCLELWTKQKLDDKADVILKDVEQRKRYDKGWLQQKGEFLSAPLVYLRNERWEGSEYSDIRQQSSRTQAKSSGADLNLVVDWIKANKHLTEKQLTSGWTWLSNGGLVVGVRIPDMPDLMFKSFTGST
jgi:hypothetical protein